jgi:hypothetical protein
MKVKNASNAELKEITNLLSDSYETRELGLMKSVEKVDRVGKRVYVTFQNSNIIMLMPELESTEDPLETI